MVRSPLGPHSFSLIGGEWKAGMKTDNHLFYGDNLDVLRNQIATESVDLIYLDPPFNSNANYNLLFAPPKGVTADAQLEAFKDT